MIKKSAISTIGLYIRVRGHFQCLNLYVVWTVWAVIMPDLDGHLQGVTSANVARQGTSVRPRATAVGAPGGDAGVCRGLRLVLCVYSTVWSCVWPPEYLSSKPVAASSLPDEAVW